MTAWATGFALLALGQVPAPAQADCAPLPPANGTILALAADSVDKRLYVAGEFTQIGGIERRHIAAIDLEDCSVTAWDALANATIRTMWLSEDDATLYVGGDFTEIGGQFRNRLAALNTATAVPTGWSPSANAPVHALLPSAFAGTFFVGGAFTVINGASRHGFVELTRPNGFIVSPRIGLEPGATVHGLAFGNNHVYFGGDFTTVVVGFGSDPDDPDSGVSVPRQRVAAFDLDDYELSPWSPAIGDGVVRALRMAPDQRTLYAGGDFTQVAGAAHQGIVALDPATAAPLAWNPQVEGAVNAIVNSFDRSLLYIGGDFTRIAGVVRERLAALRVSDASLVAGEALDLTAGVCGLHRSEDIAAASYRLYAGGGDCAGGVADGLLASFAILAPEQQPPVTTANPPGGLFSSNNIEPITLECNDFGGSGCAATYFTTNGAAPDTDSTRYTTPINLAATMVLRYFSVDQVGNAETPRIEEYLVEIEPPLTTATPGTRVFEERELQVTLQCTDTGSGCATTYYTTDGSLPTMNSPRYQGPITLTGTTVLQFFSVDFAGNIEGVKREEYVRNRGEVGALSGLECLLLLGGLWWWRMRRSS